MKVWIVEKPSAGKDLAAGLCLAFNVTSSRDPSGVLKLSNGDVILPLAGHLLQTVRPGEYLSEAHAKIERGFEFNRYKEFLPILPAKMIKVPRRELDAKGKPGKLFRPYELAVKVLKNATEIVNAGDVDREGQLIVDELLEHLNIDPYGTKPMVWRFGIASNLPQDIAKAVKAGLQKNSDSFWVLKSLAASVREYLDFCWGMNLSMVGQVQHQNPRISAGRVQTPVLAMVDVRCQTIANFVPQKYYVPVIVLQDGMVMRWYKREGSEGEPGFDTEGRIISEQLARQMVQRIASGAPGFCTTAKITQHSEKPPLPFSLSSLQAAASKELGLTLDEVGECAKALYQKHKAISYIGTDCKFLPVSMHANAPQLLRALDKVFPKQAPGADPKLMSPAFNDNKLDEHFAIVPTGDIPKDATTDEMNVFRVVARRFISQFYPDYVYRSHKIEGAFGQDQFQAAGRQDVRLGWREVEGQTQTQQAGEQAEADRDKDQPEDDIKEIC